MAEKLTPYGLVVGLIPDPQPSGEQKAPKEEAPQKVADNKTNAGRQKADK